MLQLWRVMVAGGRNFMRNAWLSTAATAVMAITLSIVALSFISNSSLTATIKGITDKIDIAIHLRTDVTPAQVNAMRASLIADPNVVAVNYRTKDQVLADFRKTKPELQSALTLAGNPLDPEIQIKAKDPKHLDSIIAIVNRADNKALLDPDPNAAPSYSGENKKSIDSIVRISSFLKRTGLIASVIFVIISTLIIFNTIRMAIFTRRDEIEIMKLVGATKWFIRGPFVFEASLYGIIGAAVALVLSYGFVLGVGPKIATYQIDIASTIALFQHNPVAVIAVEVILGICIGAFSSLLAMSRYLKL